MRSSRRSIRQRGFTLIEAMTAGVVLSILAMGLVGLWSTAGGAVNDVVIREKAIWALNGQMERLTALYQFTNFGDGGGTTSSGYGYPAAYASTRLVYGDDLLDVVGGLLGGLLGLDADDVAFLESPADFEDAEGYPVAVFALPARNYVWVDRDRDIVGRLSWQQSNVVVNTCGAENEPGGGGSACLCRDFDGSGGARCREIMLTLEYPLRWNRASNQAVAMPQPTEILSLRTIVGRRLP